MLSPEDISRQRELLNIHRQTLHHYLRQQATLGNAYTPPAVASGISEARAEIRRIKTMLRAQGAVVTDDPQDDASDGDVALPTSANLLRKYRWAIFLITGAVGVFLLLWLVALPLMQTFPTQANRSSLQSATDTTNTAATANSDSQLTVTLPQGNTLTIPYKNAKITYEITQAKVQPLNPNQSLLSLTINASTTYYQGVNFSTKQFGLRLNNEILNPISYFDEPIYPNETKEIPVEFPIPIKPAQAHVLFTIGESPIELLLEVK